MHLISHDETLVQELILSLLPQSLGLFKLVLLGQGASPCGLECFLDTVFTSFTRGLSLFGHWLSGHKSVLDHQKRFKLERVPVEHNFGCILKFFSDKGRIARPIVCYEHFDVMLRIDRVDGALKGRHRD